MGGRVSRRVDPHGRALPLAVEAVRAGGHPTGVLERVGFHVSRSRERRGSGSQWEGRPFARDAFAFSLLRPFALYPSPDEVVHDIIVGGDEAHMAVSSSGFGFGLLERPQDGHWHLTAFDQQGVQRWSCMLQARDITCTVVASSR